VKFDSEKAAATVFKFDTKSSDTKPGVFRRSIQVLGTTEFLALSAVGQQVKVSNLKDENIQWDLVLFNSFCIDPET